MNIDLSPKTALILFGIMLVFLVAQAIWWVTFMAILVDEKVELAEQMGASEEVLERIHEEEVSRQIMIGLEGIVFFIVLLAGLWLIYRSFLRLGELKRHQENFLMAVTHELKTPLASIQLYLDTLESDKISVEKKQAVIPKIRQDAERLQRLIEKALEAGRFQRDRYSIRRERFNLSEFLEERLAAWRRTQAAVKASISDHIEAGLVIQGDRSALKRAIDAVIENALKYNRHSEPCVELSAQQQGKRIVIEIRDNGLGIPKADLNRVFDRFYRVGDELTRGAEGSGLGLYLCREIIRAHGGSISAVSEGKGQGSSFRIELPMSD
jgi:signal transduction histidine kinase